jgi:hypothetical protein
MPEVCHYLYFPHKVFFGLRVGVILQHFYGDRFVLAVGLLEDTCADNNHIGNYNGISNDNVRVCW